MSAKTVHELLARVRKGAPIPVSAVQVFGLNKKATYADDAAEGSLDAAMKLHEACIPHWSVDDLSQNGMLAGHPWGIRLEKWQVNGGENPKVSVGWGRDDLPDLNPARAWLCAILEVLILEDECRPV